MPSAVYCFMCVVGWVILNALLARGLSARVGELLEMSHIVVIHVVCRSLQSVGKTCILNSGLSNLSVVVLFVVLLHVHSLVFFTFETVVFRLLHYPLNARSAFINIMEMRLFSNAI